MYIQCSAISAVAITCNKTGNTIQEFFVVVAPASYMILAKQNVLRSVLSTVKYNVHAQHSKIQVPRWMRAVL